MRKYRSFSRFVAAVLMIGLLATGSWLSPPAAKAASASELADQISAISIDLEATVAGSTVTVTGYADVYRTGLTLNIDSGVTVIWDADFEGAATANNYLLTLTGKGTFRLESGGYLTNTNGAGGTVYIDGRATSVDKESVTLEVADGTINSPGSGSAVTVAAGTFGAKINVSGGTIKSTPSGYAINDGGGMNACDNDTEINISGGLVEAGSACAIRSTGIDSKVTVSGGEVRNAAASNTNSTIYMNYAPAPDPAIENVIVTGGLVSSTNAGNQSYVIQTSQSVAVSGGTVRSIAGRAINLVGDNSIATVSGTGIVTTVSGTAISTATTVHVQSASIVVSGGLVEATGTGTAIRITGDDNTVSISGGQVLAKSGLAVNASAAITGHSPKPGCISVTGGGFVFAWGNAVTGGSNVIAPADRLDSSVGGVIVAWNSSTGVGSEPYHQDDTEDLAMLPPGGVNWEKNPGSSPLDGIRFGPGDEGFFQLNVEVIQIYFTLTINDGESLSTKILKAGDTESVLAAYGDHVDPTNSGPPYDYPIDGKKFGEWTASGSYERNFVDASNFSTSFTMPADDVVITAVYKPRYVLNVIGGGIYIDDRNYLGTNGSRGSASYGYYAEGEEVRIYKNADTGDWASTSGGSFDNAAAYPGNAVFTMPGNMTTVHATAISVSKPTQPPFKTIIDSGGANGRITGTTGGTTLAFTDDACTAPAGTGIKIEAINPDPQTYKFTGWVITTPASPRSFFENAFEPSTVFVMLEDATIDAVFEPAHTLTVNGGTGSGLYFKDNKIAITAVSPPGKVFIGWSTTALGGDTSFDVVTSRSTIFTMPDEPATITANFDEIEYTLTVINGAEDSPAITAVPYPHSFGDPVNIHADMPPSGAQFDGWIIASGSGEFDDVNSMNTSFKMSNDNAIIIATYSEAQVSPNPPFVDPGSPDSSGDGGGGQSKRNAARLAGGDVSHLLNVDDHMAYVQGVGRGLFAPDKDMSRAEVAQMFYNLLRNKNVQITRTFPDVPGNAWYRQAVGVLASLGVIEGYPDGRFHPEASITRAEFVAIAVRFTEETVLDGRLESFVDVPETHWAYNGIEAAMGYGWVIGVGEGRFEPSRHISRAEAVTMVNRMLLRAADKGFVDSHAGLVSYTDVPKSHWGYYDIVEASFAHDYTIRDDGSEAWQ